MPVIDWTDEKCLVTPHFSVKDCLWLGQNGRLANTGDGLTDEIIASLIDTCHMGEDIRALLDCPLRVTSMFRPPEYSVKVGGSSHDVHTRGMAMDFVPIGLHIEIARAIILPRLESFEIRMERGTTNWLHLDHAHPGPSGRYFTA